jgi:hypothetical protein
MKLFRALFVLALLAALVLPANAKTFPHEAGGVEVTIPDDWTEKVDGDVLHANAPDGAAGVSFMMLEAGESDKAGTLIDTELEKTLGAEIKWEKDEPAEEKINGMDCWYWIGTGTPKEGEPLVILAWVIDTPGEKELLCYCGVAAASMEKHKAALEAIVDGIKPLAKKEEKKEEKSDEGRGEGRVAPPPIPSRQST